MQMARSRTAAGTLLAGGFLLLLLNSTYLYATASPSLFYFANVTAHALGGVALAAGAAAWLRTRRPRLGPLGALSAALLGVGLLLGLVVLVLGATRPYRTWLTAHIVASTAGAVVLVIELLRRALRDEKGDTFHFGDGQQGGKRKVSPFSAAFVVSAAGLVALSGLAATYLSATHGRRFRDAHRIVNPATVPASMDGEGQGPRGPFFPSSATTNTGGVIPANFFLTSEACGRCHKDIYEQWRSSMHHFSSFNNQWYRKSIEYMQDVVGTRPSKWCAGCHDHALLFNGRFDTPVKDQIDTPEAQAGLGCLSCHAITHVRSTMGQGDFEIEYPPLHDLAASEQPVLRWVHDKLLALDPQPHREAFLKPFHTEQAPEFCSSCHKVHLDEPVNAYRWVRGFNDYDNWQASGVSGEGARSFYAPPTPKRCSDCHMPLVASNDPAARNGTVRSHRFPAANTAIPFVNGDAAQLEATTAFLQAGQVTLDVFGLVEGESGEAEAVAAGGGHEPTLSSTFAVGEESMGFGAAPGIVTPPATVIGPLDKVNAVVRRGEAVRVDVVVRTRNVGHFFPGGTVDGFDVWVEFEAVDDRGRVLMHSGSVLDGGRGPVEPSAHFYRSLMLDERGNPINKRNAFATRSVAYVRLVPPGAADTVRYRLRVPEDAGSTIQLKAKVNYRKFAWWNTQWAYAGVRDPGHADYSVGPGHDDGRWLFTGATDTVSGGMKHIPNLPIVVVARAGAQLRVVDPTAEVPEQKPFLDKSVRERWNDYGIGLLLQGDLRGAEAAFLKVTEMEPDYADGWVNVARARLQEGNTAGANEMLRKALALSPSLAKAHFFLGTALKQEGQYDEALTHLRQAAGQFPRDRVVRNQLGRVLFLKRQFREAVAEFQQVLSIDPEDLQAHYNLMLAYQGLGDREGVARERALYERFKADESSQAITGEYRRLHPHDNNERQAIHEHRDGDRTAAPTAPAAPALETRRATERGTRAASPRSAGALTGGAR
jgi:tetratricopeptide (TPR) repeat protein